MPSPTTVLKQAEGHQSLGYLAKKPDAEISQTEKSGLTSGVENQLGSTKKPHKAFLNNPNQYQGADDRKPQHPNQMTSEQIAEAALQAQKIEPKLTPSPKFSQTHTPSPSAAPVAAPTLTKS